MARARARQPARTDQRQQIGLRLAAAVAQFVIQFGARVCGQSGLARGGRVRRADSERRRIWKTSCEHKFYGNEMDGRAASRQKAAACSKRLSRVKCRAACY